MWLNTLILKLFGERDIPPIAPEVVTEIPLRLECISALLEIDPQQFQKLKYYEADELVITPAWGDIITFTNKLRQYTMHVDLDMLVNRSSLPVLSVVKNINEFLTSPSGFYLDNVGAISDFKSSGLELCTVLAKADDVPAGVREHNLRILTNILTSVRDVAEALAKVGQINQA